MALRLRIVSEHAGRLGDKATKVFGVHGGSIGRARDNDWILPDPERYLSGKHARVDFRAGNYFLVDTSSNGTYVNGAQIPLGKFHDYAMQDGDYVRMGEYELLVSIDTSNDFPPDDDAIVAYNGGPPSAAVRKSTANDLGSDLDLSELLEPSDAAQAPSGILASNAYGQPVPPPATPTAPVPPAAEAAEGTPWHMMTRPLKVDRSTERNPERELERSLDRSMDRSLDRSLDRSTPGLPRQTGPQLYNGDFDPGLATFCRGAGIDPRSLPAEARAAALQLAGQLFREAVLGLVDLNQSRSELRNRFRLPAPASEAGAGAVSFTGGVQDTLLQLLSTLSLRGGSVESLRENFRELKAQNTATIGAMQTALEEMLARFDPKELEERFERGTKRGVFGAQNKAKYWELYAELYAGLSQHPPEGFPHLFIETFGKAFEAKLRSLNPPRRGAFGGDADPDTADGGATGES